MNPNNTIEMNKFDNLEQVVLYTEISNEQSIEIDEQIYELMRNAVRASLAFEGCEGEYEVDITLVDDMRIHELNNQYRQKDSATDVLSFPQWDDVPKSSNDFPTHIGDIVINIARAVEQAENFGHSLKREMVFLTVHSAFHLLGYDHELENERKIMRNCEETVLKYLDVTREEIV